MTKPFALHDAATFLRSDLVWSDDFDSVRDSLATLLETIQHTSTPAAIEKLEPALSNFIADLMGD